MNAPQDGNDDSELLSTLALDPSPDTIERRKRACQEIWLRHQDFMIGCATAELRGQEGWKIDPLDPVQEVFALLLRPSVARNFLQGSPLRPWLGKLVRNKTRDMLRRERRLRSLLHLPRHLPTPRSPQDQLISEEDLEGILAKLQPHERALCKMFYLEGRTAKDVAKEMGYTIAQCYRNLHRIRSKIRMTVFQ